MPLTDVRAQVGLGRLQPPQPYNAFLHFLKLRKNSTDPTIPPSPGPTSSWNEYAQSEWEATKNAIAVSFPKEPEEAQHAFERLLERFMVISRPTRKDASPLPEHIRCLQAMQDTMHTFGSRMKELSQSSHVLSAAIAFCTHKDVPPGDCAYTFVSDERMAGLTNELKLHFTDESAVNLRLFHDAMMELRYVRKESECVPI
jgi:hypothetical protein